MNPDCTRLLSQPCNRILHLTPCSHQHISKLINQHNNKRKETMTLQRIQLPRKEFFIILFNRAHPRHGQEVITTLHLNQQRLKSIYNLLCISNNSLLTLRQLREEMVFQLLIERELNLLRVNQNKLQFRRMLCI